MNESQQPESETDPRVTGSRRWMARASTLRRVLRDAYTKSAALVRRMRAAAWYGRSSRAAHLFALRIWNLARASRRPILRIALIILFVEGAVWALTGPLVERIQPGMVGVRHSPWGGGVEQRDFEAGLHWNLPGLHEWHTIESGTQFAEFGTYTPALELRTPEGNLVGVAVTVPYRLIEGRAHRLVEESLRSSHADIVRANIEAVLLSELGRASSEDWLDGERRRAILDAAGRAVGDALERLHVKADRVLLQALRFPPPYESKLLEIQRGTQQRRLSEASANLKQFQLTVDRGVEENSRAVQRLRDQRDLELTELRTERQREIRLFEIESEADVRLQRLAADRVYAERLNEGKAARLTAEVEARGWVDAALAGEEGRLYLAVQAARSLQLGEVVIDARDPRVPNLLDLESATDLFLPDTD